MTDPHLKSLARQRPASVRHPRRLRRNRKAAAHAEIFKVLADAASEPLSPVLGSAVGLAYDLVVAAGHVVEGMITSSLRRLLPVLFCRTHGGRTAISAGRPRLVPVSRHMGLPAPDQRQ